MGPEARSGSTMKKRLPQERQCLGTRRKLRINSSQKPRGREVTMSALPHRGQRSTGRSP